MGRFTIHFAQPLKAKRFFADLERRYSVDIWEGGAQEGLDIERDEIKARAPNWMGHLFDSIIAGLVVGPVYGVLESTSEYSKYREFGTRRHFVPAKYIGQWAQFHLGEFTGLIVSGDATPFFRERETQTLKDVAIRVGMTVVDSMIDWLKANR